MHANWYGILPRWVRKKFGHVGTEMIGGIVGSDQEHHAAPYAITEEFISVYRLHPLLPDDYEIRDHATGELSRRSTSTRSRAHGTRPTIEKFGWSNLLYSFGIANPGAITLKNHPKALSNHVRLNGDRVDLGTIDILRDRERGVPRYNDFREKLRKKRLTKFEDLSDDPKLVEEIRDVYNDDIDRVDLQVGMLAEPLPPGFGFSDTAFRIFILMASRRLRVRPLLHQRLLARRLHARGARWVEKQHDEGRAPAPPPRAGARARGRRERVRALEASLTREPRPAPACSRTRASTRRSSSRTRSRGSSGAGGGGARRRRRATSTATPSACSRACTAATTAARSG